VGRVCATGDGVDDDWLGRRVFAFHPHESHFLATPSELIPIDQPAERATLLANAEAAASFVMDGRPRVGDRVVVFGQGVVGLLTTAVLAEFPLGELVTVDPYERRRELSKRLGADTAVADATALDAAVATEHVEGADVTFELSGNPDALDDAIDATGYAGQVIVGSWYGNKPATLHLGGEFHRSHVRVQSSQVSRIDPDHAGRWDKERRLSLVRDLLADVDVSALFSHEFPVERADDAYELLDDAPERALGVVLTYE
jgi:threonine dehydrogenase-like Zn-dependent dehydrogenase